MSVITIQSEKTIEQLIEEYYGKLPAAQLDVIKAATLEANPGVDGSVMLQPGLSIVMPPLSVAAPVPPGDTIEAIKTALSDYQERLEQKIKPLKEELEATVHILALDSFKEAIYAAPSYLHAQDFIKDIEGKTKPGERELDKVNALIQDIRNLKDKLDALSSTLP